MKRWTEEEDRLVLETVKTHASNLKEGFELLAVRLDRTPSAVSIRWYKTISKRTDKNSIALLCVSGNSCSVNRKNCKTNINNESNLISRMWNAILNLFR